MIRANPSLRAVGCLALVAAFALLGFGAPAQAEPAVANVSLGSTSVEFSPVTSFEKASLAVALPDGTVFEQTFDARSAISFDLFDRQGNRLPDGEYTWTLSATPVLSAETKARLAQARETGDDSIVDQLRRSGALPSRPLLQSGNFVVLGGSIVPKDLSEPPSATERTAGAPSLATRTTFTDSLCVGFDCPTSPSFSDSTILLMENNTRIKFDDTSTLAGFTNRDWEIAANDTASGGQNRLMINDCSTSSQGGCADDPIVSVESSSPANSLYVDSSGRIGFRTSTPVLDLHVNSGNTPGLRLEQNGSSGFAAQSWDVAGNETNFFVRDVTGGSRLPFRIRPGAPTSSIDINASGNIGLGTASPSFKVDATGNDAQVISTTSFSNDENGDLQIRRARGTSSVPTAIQLNDVIGGITMQAHDGTGFSGEVISIDARAEENFTATNHGTRITIQTTPNGSTTSQTRMVIRQNGRVGIGTVSPTELLHVNGGNVLVSGGAFIDDGTTLNAPDYVFEPDYSLMSIDELGQFIEANKHLPNVPSANEIKTSGLNLSQFQMRLLEKVEELTLYTLDQHKTIQQLQARLAELEAQAKTTKN